MFCSGPSRVSWRRGPLTSSLGRQGNHLAKKSCLGQLWTQRWGMTYVHTYTHLIGCHLTVPHRTTPHLTASHSCFILYTECVLAASVWLFATLGMWHCTWYICHLNQWKYFHAPQHTRITPISLVQMTITWIVCSQSMYVHTYVRTQWINCASVIWFCYWPIP